MKKFTTSFLVVLFLVSLCFGQQKTAAEHFDEGDEHLRAGEYKLALKSFKESARLDPKDPRAIAGVGFVSVVLNEYRDAVNAFEKAIELSPEDARYHAELCRALRLNDRPTEALSACKKAISLDDTSAPAHTYLLQTYANTKVTPEEMARLIEGALARFADHVPLLAFAASFYENYDLNRTREILIRLTDIQPGETGWKLSLASVYLKLKQDSEAIAELQKVIDLEPANPRAHFILGEVYAGLGLHVEAIEAFGTAIKAFGTDSESDQGRIEAHYLRAESENILGRYDDAVEDLRIAVASYPKNFVFRFELGQILNSAARYEEAAVELRAANEIKPDDFNVKVSFGLALFESAQFEQGIAVLTEADQLVPADPTVNMFLRVARSRQQGIADLAKMKEVEKQRPKDIRMKLILLEVLTYARKMDEAEPYIEKFWALNPADVQLLLKAAAVFMTAGDYANAEKAYRRTLEIEENPGGYFGLAMVYQKRGEVEKVIESYKKAFALQERSPGFLKVYGDVLRESARHEEALEAYKKSLSYQPNFAPAVQMAGIVCVKLGLLDEAKIYLERLRPLNPEQAQTLERYLRWKAATVR